MLHKGSRGHCIAIQWILRDVKWILHPCCIPLQFSVNLSSVEKKSLNLRLAFGLRSSEAVNGTFSLQASS